MGKLTDMFAVYVAVFACLAFQAQAGKVCTDTAQCAADECCQIMSEFQIASKRQLVADLKPVLATLRPLVKTGTCEKYKREGDHCSSMAAMNGYCMCEPGYYCHTYEEALPTVNAAPAGHLRSMLAPRPGYHWVSECTKNN